MAGGGGPVVEKNPLSKAQRAATLMNQNGQSPFKQQPL